MPIIINLDQVMAEKKVLLKDLANEIGISNVNLSKLKTGKVAAIRFSTLEAICKALNCQPGDILEYVNEESRNPQNEHER
ncbi:helix-turn-helix domain-containing protein [Jeotgalibaca ciconiae]|uniref:Transcriptional regulator n=1 Tax=Jeotgalibaca ciconiae TaxID=2496265 RepID=A0A3Q9BJB2_9LACT|nr:helix-turn-helix transcriptional regulator [Jeotgalibaca ciconiae]AZP03209.1 transcriptional regulator [Jeotgalibaca ciconiae]AZP05612.1 transcriptional regulator [Jeotgalibaca ciconiae]